MMSLRINIDRMIIWLLGAIFIVPFLITANYYPLPKFYAEVSCLILVLTLILLIIYRIKMIHIPVVSIGCFLFAFLLLLQPFIIQIKIRGINLSIATEFIVAACLSFGITSYALQSQHFLYKIIKTITWSIVLSATIQSIYGLLQLTKLASDLNGYVLYIDNFSYHIFGNFGQRNNYADFLSIGIVTLSYLFLIKRIRINYYICYLLIFMYLISVTAARTPFLYFFIILLYAIYLYFNKRNIGAQTEKAALYLFIGLIFMFSIIEYFSPILTMLITNNSSITNSGLLRISFSTSDVATYRRFYEWYKALLIFWQHPLVGVGWFQYQFSALSLMLDPEFSSIPPNSGLFTNCHNLFFMLLAETGISGFLIITLTLIIASWQIFKMDLKETKYFTFPAFLVVLIHSLVEYPLWDFYFLAFVVIFLSINKPIFRFRNSIYFKLVATGIYLLVIYVLGRQVIEYQKLLVKSVIPMSNQQALQNISELEMLIQQNNFLAWPALLVLNLYIDPDKTPELQSIISLDTQLYYINLLVNEYPTPDILLKQIILAKQNGDQLLSLYYANLFIHAYPLLKEGAKIKLSGMGEFAAELDIINKFNSLN